MRAPDGADDALTTVAARLVDAYRRGRCIEAPSRTIVDFSKANALAIAQRVRQLRIAGGDEPAGYKVGFTNPAVRRQFAAEAQLAAPVYRQTVWLRPRVLAGALLGPRIEPEIVVGIGPNGAPVWAALGFEIVQSHVADWDFTYLDAVADFGLHAGLIVGERRAFPADGFIGTNVRLSRNGDIVEHGASSDVDGGPLGAIAWLRDDLRRSGHDLLPDEVVSTGSLTRVPAIAAGERWTIETAGNELPALTIDIE